MPLVVLTGVIPLILIAIFYASDRAAKKIRQEARENMALKADLLAESVNRWDELNVKAVINLSRQPGIISINPARQTAVLKNTIDTYDHFYLAMTTDLEGWNVARSDEPKRVFFGDRDWFLGAKAGNDLTYQTLIGRTSKRLAVCLSAPNKNEQIEILGVSVACTDLGDIVKQVGELKFGNTGYAILVDENGTVLAHPDLDFVSGKRLKDLSTYPPVKYLLEGGRGHFSFQDYEGVEWVSYDAVLNNKWGIVVVQEKWEFLQSAQEFQNLAFLIASVSVIGVSIVTWFLANRLISPISNLTDAASAISDGQLDRKVIIKSQDELGILANSFNYMAEKLKTFFDNLEKQIEERTAELKEAKEAAERAKEAAEAANKSKDRFL
ncbi:MAG: cache domain-containing protein, partial [Prochloraceae cyanobacterium]